MAFRKQREQSFPMGRGRRRWRGCSAQERGSSAGAQLPGPVPLGESQPAAAPVALSREQDLLLEQWTQGQGGSKQPAQPTTNQIFLAKNADWISAGGQRVERVQPGKCPYPGRLAGDSSIPLGVPAIPGSSSFPWEFQLPLDLQHPPGVPRIPLGFQHSPSGSCGLIVVQIAEV